MNPHFLLPSGTDITDKIRLVAMRADGRGHVYRYCDEGWEEEVEILPGPPVGGTRNFEG